VIERSAEDNLKSGTQPSNHPQLSLIKPYLLNLSGSGSKLNGIIVERNLEQPHADIDSATVKAAKHLIVVHARHPASLEWSIDGRRKEAMFSEGDAIINPVGLFVAPHWDAKVELLLVAIDPIFINQIAEEMDRPGRVELIPHFQFRDGLLQQLVYSLNAEFEQDIPPDFVYIESLTHASIAHLIKKYSVAGLKQSNANQGLSPRKLALVMNYINDHLGETLSLEAIAKVAEISPSHFMTRFKQSTGLAPHQYVMAQRIEKAKVLLTQSRLPISDIAVQIGFADQSHLTRLLRRYTGMTPKILRDK